MSGIVIVKDKLLTIKKDKNDLYYVANRLDSSIEVYRLLEKWAGATRDWSTRHPIKDMKHILKFMKLNGIEFGLETELWLAKEDE